MHHKLQLKIVGLTDALHQKEEVHQKMVREMVEKGSQRDLLHRLDLLPQGIDPNDYVLQILDSVQRHMRLSRKEAVAYLCRITGVEQVEIPVGEPGTVE